jgi:hypothetical protein
MALEAAANEQAELTEDLSAFVHDPLGAVLYGFPWGVPGTDLEKDLGPRKWQAEILDHIGAHLSDPKTRHTPCRVAVSSGHDIGKTALISMVSWWAQSTFEDTRENITANTGGQLATKTQPELAKWFRLAINADWFEVNVTSVKIRDDEHRDEWRLDFTPWSEANPAAAAGLHNKRKRLLLVFDEASEIPKIIFEVAEGVMLDEDTEIIWLVFGNPTRNQGPFYDAVFGTQRHRWKHFVIDSRDVEGTNKQQLQEWLEDYGEESDFFRVRARGLPPRSNSGQFIDQELITGAQKRAARALPDDPLVAGVDFAWGGSDDNVIRFRKGYDAASIAPIKVKGELTREPAIMTAKLADVLTRTWGPQNQKVAMLFLDSAGIAAPVEARLRAMGFKNLCVVNFGADSPSTKCAYFRDYMWAEMKEWLRLGAIDKDPDLAADLAKPVLVEDRKQRIKLEPKDVMKKRMAKLGIDSSSPDDGDALALTFAMKVAPPRPKPAGPPKRRSAWS